jgi:hypothetical protein
MTVARLRLMLVYAIVARWSKKHFLFFKKRKGWHQRSNIKQGERKNINWGTHVNKGCHFWIPPWMWDQVTG